MAFIQVMSFIAGAVEIAPPKDVTVYEFNADGELVLSTSTNVDSAVIALEAGAGEAEIRCAWIAPGAIYKVPVTDADGTALTAWAATLVVGARARINATGTGMDGENVHAAANPLTIIKVDTTNEVAWVAFNTCLLALNA